MKKIILTFICVTTIGSLFSQVIVDTVSIGTGYINQTWYSLENNEQGTKPKNEWDIAFETTGFGYSILINSITGTQLWLYPKGDTSSFATVDTSGLSSWTPLYNSDTSWRYGAFSLTQSGLDLGWGNYSTITNQVVGDSIYVIKLSSGVYQKIWIQKLASGTYTFRHATLNNSMDMLHSLSKSSYSGKNFAYFSLQTHTAIDREPASADWDLLFTQYTAFIPIPYTVSGVVSNYNTSVARAYPVNNPANYNNYSAQPFESRINAIGYNWKSYQGSWVIADSTVYFVKTQAGDIWKIIFTDFGGSANGNYIFSKEKLLSSGLDENKDNLFVKIYPNPATSNLNIVYDNPEGDNASLVIFDMSGKMIKEITLQAASLSVETINTSGLTPGAYFVSLQIGSKTKIEKLIIH